jgi:hypothetical protein
MAIFVPIISIIIILSRVSASSGLDKQEEENSEAPKKKPRKPLKIALPDA